MNDSTTSMAMVVAGIHPPPKFYDAEPTSSMAGTAESQPLIS